MFSVHLLAYYFSKLKEDPTKKVGSCTIEQASETVYAKNINENKMNEAN